MKRSIYRISLDIHEPASQLSFSVNRGDTTRRLKINLTENGKPYEIAENAYAIFTTVKSDGNPICNDCTIKNNTIIYDITEQTTAIAGVLDCSIVLYSTSGDQLTSPRFTVIVYETVHQDISLTSTDEYTALSKQLTEAQACIEGMNALTDEVQEKLDNGEFIGEQGVSVTELQDMGYATEQDGYTSTTVHVTFSDDGTDSFKVYAKNGDRGMDGARGRDGASIHSTVTGHVLLENPTYGQTVFLDFEENTMSPSVNNGDLLIDGLGNVYKAENSVGYGATCRYLGYSIKGIQGEKGEKGEKGVGISTVESRGYIQEGDYTVNTLAFLLTGGTYSYVNVYAKNGSGGGSAGIPIEKVGF